MDYVLWIMCMSVNPNYISTHTHTNTHPCTSIEDFHWYNILLPSPYSNLKHPNLLGDPDPNPKL